MRRKTSIPTLIINFQDDERAWEGQYDGRHWIARIVQMDEKDGICGLHVASGAGRDEVAPKPNCNWDYECDHFPNRFSSGAVPPGVTTEMVGALREWLRNFRQQYKEPKYLHATLDMGLLP